MLYSVINTVIGTYVCMNLHNKFYSLLYITILIKTKET